MVMGPLAAADSVGLDVVIMFLDVKQILELLGS